ncbi:MAG: ROK family protein [Clostridiaceae bacterium]
MKKYVIGIDLGGTKITTAIADFEGKLVEKLTVPTEANKGEAYVMDKIIDTVSSVLKTAGLEASDIASIGIGTPGPVDSSEGKIITTPNLPFRDYSLTKPLFNKFGIPAYLENDGNVAAIGEWMFGAGRGFKNVLYMTVSTGVGGGAVLNGAPYNGSSSNAMEIGHITIDPHSKHRCNCGNYGDLESLTSGFSISKRALEAIAEGKETTLSKYTDISAKEIYDEYLKGDKVSIKILDDAFESLGIGIANLILIFDPDVIAIGGGVTRIGDMMFEKVRESARKRAFSFMVDKVKIVPSGLLQDTGVIGAVALAIVESKKHQ